MDAILEELQKGAVYGAKALLGRELVTKSTDGVTAGIIVETEAYTQDDPASHAFRGETKRNAAMFQSSGTIYVYFTYGMHYCVNIVCGDIGVGEAVLIRAIQPTVGIEIMEQRRGVSGIRIANGPAKLTQALGITLSENAHMLGNNITLKAGITVHADDITTGPRIGISKAQEELARFYIKDNIYVSRP